MFQSMGRGWYGVCVFGLLLSSGGAAAAQDSPGPNTGALRLSGGVDVANAYHFRGIPQDESGVIMWPYGDLGLSLYTGEAELKSLTANVGWWNSLHTGAVGLDGPARQLRYESDFYASLGAAFGGGVSVSTTYTAYTSPNGSFQTVRELAFKLALDDAPHLGAAAVKPYALVAFEVDGQADGGAKEGRYLEVGIAPARVLARVTLAAPVKLGLSLGHYYENAGVDERFGFLSVGAVATVPMSQGTSRFGAWNVHGGVEYLKQGHRNQTLGANNVVVSMGLGFTY